MKEQREAEGRMDGWIREGMQQGRGVMGRVGQGRPRVSLIPQTQGTRCQKLDLLPGLHSGIIKHGLLMKTPVLAVFSRHKHTIKFSTGGR
ncbi:hypothetical protein E2C01_102814 [Portunus trituberculatus]|uniref:Uncharacterized protein n=1 Tax=Portunus trituberculatus TaxID=210409 RepID=A0A5B7KQ18_PORTR|nr:hypothetical protein [Portunus trituberculatus]